MQQITQAVILAGGSGTRLKPFTLENPKPMIPINGRPFLEHLLTLLKTNGIKEVILLTGYLGDKIKNYFGDGFNLGIRIKYSYTPFKNEKNEEYKSGVRLKNAYDLLKKRFLLLYCDNYWPLQLNKLVKYFNQHPSDVLVTVYSNKDFSTSSNIKVSKTGYVSEYDPTRSKKNLNGVDIGFFVVKKSVIKLLRNNIKFEDKVLPKLIKRNRLSGYLTDQKYYSISDLKRKKITEKFLKPKKVVFLDRDGVINKKPAKADYVKKWEEFEFLPRAIDAIKILNKKGFKIYLITNQPGIGRGLMTKKDLEQINKNMLSFLKKNSAKIDDIFYCPHNWNEGCECRKPKPGLLYQASAKHYIDLTNSIFIGDDTRDLKAGIAAGCKTFLISKRKSLLNIVELLAKDEVPQTKN